MPDIKLVNMKMAPKTSEEKTAAAMPGKIDRPLYPWGLSITLDNDALDKLGLASLPTAGGSLSLEARVDVTSVSENESTDGGTKRKNRSVGLQITDLGLGSVKKDTDAAAAPYKTKA